MCCSSQPSLHWEGKRSGAPPSPESLFARFYNTDPPGAQKFYGDTLPEIPVCSGETRD